jgi:hypothetical protein
MGALDGPTWSSQANIGTGRSTPPTSKTARASSSSRNWARRKIVCENAARLYGLTVT